MAEKKKKPFGTQVTQGTNPFTVDTDTSKIVEVPTITRLLNRKKLGKDTRTIKTVSGVSEIPKPLPPVPSYTTPPPAQPDVKKPPQEAPEPITLATENTEISEIDLTSVGGRITSPSKEKKTEEAAQGEISLSTEVSDAPLQLEGRETSESPSSSARVQAAKPRAEQHQANRLALWALKQLKSGSDPLGKGVAAMVEKGAHSALFLAILPPPAGSPVPHFVASAAVADRDRIRLWTGMKWDPTVVPELWNVFVRTGFVELSPPGTTTNIKSNRNVVRTAFGAGSHEWLLLVRAGPANTCRGVLALIAQRSLLTELGAVLPLIAAPAPGKKAA